MIYLLITLYYKMRSKFKRFLFINICFVYSIIYFDKSLHLYWACYCAVQFEKTSLTFIWVISCMFNFVNGFDILFQLELFTKKNFVNYHFNSSVCLEWSKGYGYFSSFKCTAFLFSSSYSCLKFKESRHFHFVGNHLIVRYMAAKYTNWKK